MSLAKPTLGRPERPSMPLVLFGKVYVATPLPGAGYALRPVEQGDEQGAEDDMDQRAFPILPDDSIRAVIASPV